MLLWSVIKLLKDLVSNHTKSLSNSNTEHANQQAPVLYNWKQSFNLNYMGV